MIKIKDLTGKVHEIKSCLGCEINERKICPFGGILYEDDFFSVIQDFELPIEGFIIISTKRHIEMFTELSFDERDNLVNLINKILLILKNYNVCDEFNVVLEGKKGYRFHIWLMPRHKWMIDKFGKVLKNIKQIQDYALDNLSTIENFNKIEYVCEILKRELNK